jgi:hypothetical protein
LLGNIVGVLISLIVVPKSGKICGSSILIVTCEFYTNLVMDSPGCLIVLVRSARLESALPKKYDNGPSSLGVTELELVFVVTACSTPE